MRFSSLCILVLDLFCQGLALLISEEERYELNPTYPRSNITRVNVPPESSQWEVELSNYKPRDFTHESVFGQYWADEDISPNNKAQYEPKWNNIDGEVNRKLNRPGRYLVNGTTGRPLNPTGRTGIAGRGLLGRWGPNHASSVIVTRWFRDYSGNILEMEGKPMLEFIAVKFYGKWGLPGGFNEPGENYEQTARREFLMEALNGMNMTRDVFVNVSKTVDEVCRQLKFTSVYSGYMDDERNTDNAWIEGEVTNLHEESGGHTFKLKLCPGDGAEDVKWLMAHKDMTIDPASKKFIKYVAKNLHKAHW